MTDIYSKEYADLMQLAEDYGLCCNCFHTLECCGGKCPQILDMEHICLGGCREARSAQGQAKYS